MAEGPNNHLIINFAMAAAMGIISGRQLSGKKASPSEVAREAFEFAAALEERARYLGLDKPS